MSMTAEEVKNKLSSNTNFNNSTGCWLYLGHISATGYGKINFRGRVIEVNRISAHIYHGLDLSDSSNCALHKLECPNKNCWNPDHIYVGTHQENTKDMDIKGRMKRGRYKTHCLRGHEYTEENTRIDKKGAQTCRECNRLRYYSK